MAEEFVVGPFGRLLPRPDPPLTHTVPVSNIRPHESPVVSNDMNTSGYFSKDEHINNGLPGLGQQLPSVSHLLNGYHEYPPPGDRPPSQEGLGIFHRPQYSRGDSGGLTQGVPGSFRRYSNQYNQYSARHCNGSDIPFPGPFPVSSPNPELHLHRRSNSSLLSRTDGPASSGSNTTRDQPRLPRMIGEEEVLGKGLCYIYDDGSHCPKAIEGDSVNPQWGVTKAGKPRKRLAQACTTCREKKIRCDPGSGVSKCSQCLKFNRECRFEQQQQQVYVSSELHLYPC